MPETKINISDLEIKSSSENILINQIPGSYITKGCLNGVCRVCRCKLLSGKVVENGKTISSPDSFLPCISKPLTDVKIQPSEKRLSTGKVERINRFKEGRILEVIIKTKMQFYNPKSIINIFDDSLKQSRSYSVVTLYDDRFDTIRIHVKLIENGVFSAWLNTLDSGDEIKFQVVNQPVPQHEDLGSAINIVAGGSGMGAALSRALDLYRKHSMNDIYIIAINRSELSSYHQHCIKIFKDKVDCEVFVKNVHFEGWISKGLSNYLWQDIFTLSVGSSKVTDRILSLKDTEVESFG